MFYIAVILLTLSVWVAAGNIIGCIAALIRKKRGIDKGYSSVPLFSFLFGFLSWLGAKNTIGLWAFLPAILDPGTLMFLILPWVMLKEFRKK